MDIISQLQEEVNNIAVLALNTFGTLQRDAPPVRLSPNYPEPAVNPSDETINVAEHPKTMSAALVKAAKKFDLLVNALPLSGEDAQLKRIAELQVSLLGSLKKSIFTFIGNFPQEKERDKDHSLFSNSMLIDLKKIRVILMGVVSNAENEIVGLDLQKQLEAAELELKQVQELFSQAADNCLNLKKPD